MATLQNIRNKGGVITTILLGMALLAFILGDLIKNGPRSGKSEGAVTEINGTELSSQELTIRVNNRTTAFGINGNDYDDKIGQLVWDELVQTYVMEDEYDALGINHISEDELNEYLQGNEPHKIIVENFKNPQTNVFDKSNLIGMITRREDDARVNNILNYFEEEIKLHRKFEKFNSMVAKGFYANTLDAKKDYKQSFTNVNVEYVAERFSTIADTAVAQPTEEELKAYYAANKENYKQTESRDLEMVIFNVNASDDDHKKIEEEVASRKEDFIKADSAMACRIVEFASSSGFNRVAPTFSSKEDLPETIADFMFTSDTGAVYGPYFEDEAYKLSKLLKVDYLPDSASARHILIAAQGQDPQVWEQAKLRADSVLEMVNNGVPFEILVNQYSDDPGSKANGGKYEWFKANSMVKPFEDACFKGNVGDVSLVPTQYGFHIIEVLAKGTLSKKVQVATITKKVYASSETINAIFSKARSFASNNRTIEDFNAAIDADPTLKSSHVLAPNLKRDSRYVQGLNGITNIKPILAWAFYNEENTVSEIAINLESKMFVVPALTAVKDNGIASFDQVKDKVTAEVLKEKKTAKIIAKIESANASTLSDLGNALNSPVETANNIGISNGKSIASEAKVLGNAMYGPLNTVSAPIIGKDGVYVISTTAINSSPEPTDYTQQKNKLMNKYEAISYLQWYFPEYYSPALFIPVAKSPSYNLLLEEAEIVDNRLERYIPN